MAGGGLRAAFMREALAKILADAKHPLSFLVDRTTGRWKSRHMYSEEPTVQAGHLVSRHSGDPERLALEDSALNQVFSGRGETQGVIFQKSAVLIGDIPVEVTTAQRWEGAEALPAGTVKKAQPTQGWFRR